MFTLHTPNLLQIKAFQYYTQMLHIIWSVGLGHASFVSISWRLPLLLHWVFLQFKEVDKDLKNL